MIQHDEFLWFYKILENSGVKYRPYSGRFMFHKTCLGIVCEDAIQTISQLLIEITDGIYASEKREEDVQTFAEWLLRAKTDSMGMSQILYFPSIPWIDEIDESEDEDEE